MHVVRGRPAHRSRQARMQPVEVLWDERIEADAAYCRNKVSSRVRILREPCLYSIQLRSISQPSLSDALL